MAGQRLENVHFEVAHPDAPQHALACRLNGCSPGLCLQQGQFSEVTPATLAHQELSRVHAFRETLPGIVDSVAVCASPSQELKVVPCLSLPSDVGVWRDF